MTRPARISLYILTPLLVTASILYLSRERIKAYFIPAVEQTGDINIRVENDTCYIRSSLIAKNRSFLKIGVDTIKYQVALFGQTYLRSEDFVGMVLHPHAADTIDFSLKIPYKKLIKDLRSERKKGDSASYSIVVALQYSTFLGRSEMPINKTARLKIPQPPELEIIDIKYTKVRMKSIHANVKVKITNFSNVDLSIKQMSYSINVLKQGNLKGFHSETINIRPRGTTFVIFPIDITPRHLARTVFDVLLNRDSYAYALELHAILESPDPMKRSFTLNLTKSGEMELKK